MSGYRFSCFFPCVSKTKLEPLTYSPTELKAIFQKACFDFPEGRIQKEILPVIKQWLNQLDETRPDFFYQFDAVVFGFTVIALAAMKENPAYEHFHGAVKYPLSYEKIFKCAGYATYIGNYKRHIDEGDREAAIRDFFNFMYQVGHLALKEKKIPLKFEHLNFWDSNDSPSNPINLKILLHQRLALYKGKSPQLRDKKGKFVRFDVQEKKDWFKNATIQFKGHNTLVVLEALPCFKSIIANLDPQSGHFMKEYDALVFGFTLYIWIYYQTYNPADLKGYCAVPFYPQQACDLFYSRGFGKVIQLDELAFKAELLNIGQMILESKELPFDPQLLDLWQCNRTKPQKLKNFLHYRLSLYETESIYSEIPRTEEKHVDSSEIEVSIS